MVLLTVVLLQDGDVGELLPSGGRDGGDPFGRRDEVGREVRQVRAVAGRALAGIATHKGFGGERRNQGQLLGLRKVSTLG